MADRIVVFGSDPGYIRAELQVGLPHPRSEQDLPFRKLVDRIYTLMTTESRADGEEGVPALKRKKVDLGYRVPEADISELTGLVEAMDELGRKGGIDLPELADWLNLNVDDLFPLTEVLEILDFAKVSYGDIQLTPAGKTFANADILERKKQFAAHLLKYVPLVTHIRNVLDERRDHRASRDRFLTELEDYLTELEAERVLRVVIDWARYAEIFAYNDQTGILSLENPH